jgi:predicted ABC-class ATPase
VDISAFLGPLPSGVVARRFTTEKGSGSTSQAAAIIEAIEVGAKLLLLDEDRCATNFMIRDGRMQRLVPKPEEPITPYLDRVRELYDRFGVSTILVTGGSGDYLEVADTVIRMKNYRAMDGTGAAREIAAATESMRLVEEVTPMELPRPRVPQFEDLRGEDPPMRFGLRGPRGVRAGNETIPLESLEQLVETGQTRAVARSMRRLVRASLPPATLREWLEQNEAWLDGGGLDRLDDPVAYDLSRPRLFELAAALNRWRALTWNTLHA